MNFEKAKYTIYFVTIFISTICFTTHIVANPVEKKGWDIIKKKDVLDSGWKTSQANMEMTIKNSLGAKAKRFMKFKSMEKTNTSEGKNLTIFTFPADVKNTAFLSHAQHNQEDNQWLYLPSIKRIKRIASSQKSGSFMGSEFSYEDLSIKKIEAYSYKFIANDHIDGKEMFIVEAIPKDKYSAYSKLLRWIDKKHYQDHKIEYYDQQNKLLKVLLLFNYQSFLNEKYWRAGEMIMRNTQTKNVTTIKWSNYEFGAAVSFHEFTVESLRRIR